MNSDMKYNAIDENKDIDKNYLKAQEKPQQTSAVQVNRMNRKSILRLTVAGVFTALILLATELKVPTAIGYANMGDGVILLASYLLGPAAFFPAAIGSALADLLAGYAPYIPATFVIKGLMGLVAGLLMKNEKVTVIRRLIAFVIAEVIMVAGYFAFESLPFMYGPAAAAGSILSNLAQGAAGIVAAVLLTSLLTKLRTAARSKML